MQRLTKSEEEIMQLFWELGPATVSDLISKMDDPKPPHSTISSIVRILEKKDFLTHKAYGRTYEYHPAIDKSAYSKYKIMNLVSHYFDGSPNQLVSFLVKENDLSISELNALLNQLDQE